MTLLLAVLNAMPYTLQFNISRASGIIHLFRGLSYDRSIDPSKSRSPQSATWCLLFQSPVYSVVFNVIQQLLMSFSLSSRHVYISFNNMFYKAVPKQDVTNQISRHIFLIFAEYSSSPHSLCVILPLFLHDRSHRSSPSFSSATFKNAGLYGIKVLLRPTMRNKLCKI